MEIIAKKDGLYFEDQRIKRLNLRSFYGNSTGRLIFEYPSDKVRFSGENMDQKLLEAAHLAKDTAERARLTGIEERIDSILEQAGWEIYPA